MIQGPARSIETACCMRYCLLNTTDRLQRSKQEKAAVIAVRQHHVAR
jgi:hypothetical protein